MAGHEDILQPEYISLQCLVELPQKLQQSLPGRGISSVDADDDDAVVEDIISAAIGGLMPTKREGAGPVMILFPVLFKTTCPLGIGGPSPT